MNINYSSHIELLQVEPIRDLKGYSKLITWQVMCMIIHFTATEGSCKLPKNQLAKHFGVSIKFLSKATELLLSIDWIKEVKAYDRVTQSAAIYTTSIGYRNLCLNLWSPRPKPIVTTTKEKEFQKNSKQEKEDLSSSSSLNEKSTYIPKRQRQLRNS